MELLLKPRLPGECSCQSWDDGQWHSVFTVSDFATVPECEALIASASRLLASYGDATPPPRSRLAIVSKTEGVLLRRCFALVETRLPALAVSLFGTSSAAELEKMSIRYSPGEPAVNVYTAGGNFSPHTDKQSLTLLVPLSPAGAFEGGGTAFWKDSHHAPRGLLLSDGSLNPYRIPTDDDAGEVDENDENHWLPHDHVLRPPRGTAIIFGGDVTHSGLPVTSGTRHLFVMSFTLKKRTLPVAVAAPEREDSGDDETVDAEGLGDFADLFL